MINGMQKIQVIMQPQARHGKRRKEARMTSWLALKQQISNKDVGSCDSYATLTQHKQGTW